MTISLILPYWDRQAAADKALRQMGALYAGLDLEVVVVDDGNVIPFVAPDVPLNIKVIRRPLKSEPKSCISAWNEGVRQSSGEIIVLSCIEVLHEKPVLAQMAEHLYSLGESGYVLAAAWCPEHGIWHCHSTVSVPDCPSGTGISFCGALHRSLFEKVGGFDEAYAEGAGYEDRDFIRKLVSAGAKFVIRDDLAVTHPKAGASISWPAGHFERNEAIYRAKWSAAERKLTFVCLKAGAAFGAEYVNILYDMVSRNLSKRDARFVCLTDDPAGLNTRIVTMPLPTDLETWWGKLYLFKRGVFQDGERVIFLDLDTLIVGSLNDLANYDGEFATLNDFYRPERVGPAVMLWRAGGKASAIWDAWEAAGKPRNPMGDLWWINQLDGGRFAAEADKLQALYPRQFVSFKAHCHPLMPKGAKVVCFHGQPRPHNCTAEWVQHVWKEGGYTPSMLEALVNERSDRVAANIRYSCSLPVPWLPLLEPHDGDAVLVGGGPSLARGLDELLYRKARGAKVFATNGAYGYLLRAGIKADYHIIIDARPGNADFVEPGKGAKYIIASQCDRALFDKLAGEDLTVFHLNTENVLDSIQESDKPIHLVSAGSTVGLFAMSVAYCLGYRKEHLYGYDSSYGESHHAYPQPSNDADSVIEAMAAGRSFKASPWMVMQAQQFQELAASLVEGGCLITVNGDGLLPHIAHQMAAESQELEAA